MKIRVSLIVIAVGVALGFVAGGCGDDTCASEQMDLIDTTVPTSCPTMARNAQVTVSFQACARCNQTNPTCSVDTSTGFIELNTLGEACESGGSCPLPSCEFGEPDRRTVTCTFRTPDAPTVGLVIHDTAGPPTQFTVDLSGGATACSG